MVIDTNLDRLEALIPKDKNQMEKLTKDYETYVLLLMLYRI